MELRDLIVTPIILVFIYAAAYALRPFVTSPLNRVYFIPALTLKIVGALALGFIYQFYYGSGDTFIYHVHGSRHIWEAFMKSPSLGLHLFFADGKLEPELYDYFEKIWYFRDPRSYFIIRIAFIFDLLTFSTYSATAILFSVVGFMGGWMLFLTFFQKYPHLHRYFAVACLFVPSVIFWGSGLLKDTITLACIGAVTYHINRIVVMKKITVSSVVVLLLSLYCVFVIRKFVLQAYFPAVVFWVAMSHYNKVRSSMARALFWPAIMVVVVGSSYLLIAEVGKGDKRYALDRLAETSRITAYDIRYWTGSDAGSGYTLGDLDGTMWGMVKLAPKAINVALFRPYPWEAANILMILSSMESTLLLLVTVYLLLRYRKNLARNWQNSDVVFCLIFALGFAFGVGVSTFNFGSLVRYRIPLIPFYLIALIIISQPWATRGQQTGHEHSFQ